MFFEPAKSLSPKTGELYQLILARIKELDHLKPLQSAIIELFQNPRLTVLNRDFSQTSKNLANLGLVKDEAEFERYIKEIAKKGNDISFCSSPGSRMNDHHSFPGGLVAHVAADIEHALSTAEDYRKIYGVKADRELLIAALALHDIAKPNLFPWSKDGTYPDELLIAGTTGHHIFSTSELIYRGFSFPIVKAAAFCHAGTASPEQDLRNFLTAAYLIAGKSPPEQAFWQITIEDWICMYADSDGNIIGWVRRQLSKDKALKGLEKAELFKLLATKSEFGLYNDLQDV